MLLQNWGLTISTSDNLDIERTYMDTPTVTEGPEKRNERVQSNVSSSRLWMMTWFALRGQLHLFHVLGIASCGGYDDVFGCAVGQTKDS
jgi:hypothetical protein